MPQEHPLGPLPEERGNQPPANEPLDAEMSADDLIEGGPESEGNEQLDERKISLAQLLMLVAVASSVFGIMHWLPGEAGIFVAGLLTFFSLVVIECTGPYEFAIRLAWGLMLLLYLAAAAVHSVRQ